MVTINAANEKTGASGTILQGQGVGTASDFSTATYPATTTSQQILYSTGTNVVGQLTIANSALAATNSSGTLAMRAFSVVIQVFTGTGTYTPTAGMLYCIIECLGGGGAGGGSTNAGVGTYAAGGGGGGGEYAVGVFSAATIGASKSVTIGAGGTGVSGAGGNTGGTTSVGSTNISAVGGVGGTASTASAGGSALGGLGGTGGTGGSYRTPGAAGSIGVWTVGGGYSVPAIGANSQKGAGGNSVAFSNTGNAGLGYGAGGGGSNSSAGAGGGAFTGGAGSAGIVVVTEYVIA